MKILLVQESDWLRKGPHQQHHLMERLSLRSHEIRVIDFQVRWTSTEKGPLFSSREEFKGISKVHEDANITLIRPGILKMPLLEFASILFSHTREIKFQIRQFAPDAIFGFEILNTLMAMQLARRSGIPFFYYLIDELHTLLPYRVLRPLARLIEGHVLRHATGVFVINEKLRDFAIALGADPDRTFVIRAGIDPERFSQARGRTEIRDRYGFRSNDVVLFFMGGIFSFSGIIEVALGLAEVRSEHPQIKFLVVGRARKADFQRKLESTIKRNGLQGIVILEGWQPYDSIPGLIAASDICLLPAHDNDVMHNIVPIKIYEYMISGKPVISTRLPGVMREFGTGNGVTYADGPSHVVAKVIEMIDGRIELRTEGEKARAFVQKYTWDRIVNEFMEALDEAMTDSTRKAG